MKALFNDGKYAVTKDEITKGEVFNFFGYEWQVVKVDGDNATFWMKNPDKRVCFNIDSRADENDYSTSHVRDVLLEYGAEVHKLYDESEFITRGYLGDDFYLPSKGEIEDGGEWGLTDKDRSFERDDYPYYAWLRSAYSSTYAWSVAYGGGINSSYYYSVGSSAFLLRPAVMLDISTAS
jgi:hypothetical protein